ncbi:MAG: hypothetical protein SGI84_06595 [Gemmatimonadota bacterium]|nr:hypothetical protein [Gemmatimonadota bacterium]
MSDSALLTQLAALNAAVGEFPIISGVEDGRFEELEEVKRGLDDMRLGLWGRLQGVHDSDAEAYSERFRIRRCQEICTRLSTDLDLGLMSASHPEFSDLWITLTQLAAAIQQRRKVG